MLALLCGLYYLLAISHCMDYDLVCILPSVHGHIDAGILFDVYLDVGGPWPVPQRIIVLGRHRVDTIERVAAVRCQESVRSSIPCRPIWQVVWLTNDKIR